MVITAQSANLAPTAFAAMSARRLLIFGGIALIAGGMLFGDIFAVFVLHQNGGQTGEAFLAASRAAAVGNSLAVKDSFQRIGGLLEDHGTKVDAHVHMTGAGYLALMLALLQPYVALPQAKKRLLAWWFVAGGLLLPIGIFLIHYVGLAYSPSSVIGWASVLADSAGAILIAVLAVEACALWKHFRSEQRHRTGIAPGSQLGEPNFVEWWNPFGAVGISLWCVVCSHRSVRARSPRESHPEIHVGKCKQPARRRDGRSC
jgi:hypothetical protein